jgi:uncharacterized protein
MTGSRNETIGRLNYVEFSVAATDKAKSFYQEAFGWTFIDFGPTYASTVSGDVDIGLQAAHPNGSKPPLPVIHVASLEAAHQRTLAAGAVLIVPIFSFPGGRRFHVRDPSGNEIAVWQTEEAQP